MSLPVATTITGMDSPDVLHQNLDVARGFKPMSAAEMQALRERCSPPRATAASSSTRCRLKYDNPEAREAHGFPLDDKQMEVQEELASAKSTGKMP